MRVRFPSSWRIKRFDRFILPLDSITCSFRLRLLNLFFSWQHVCTLVMPEAEGELAWKGSALDSCLSFAADGLYLI